MKKITYCWFALMLYSASLFALPSVKMTIKVVDESGQPIEGATAELIFSYTPSGGRPVASSSKGLTDSNGLFVGTGESIQYFTYSTTKEGYYPTTNKFKLSKITGIPGFRNWEPWNPTIEIMLKKKENPIPMYAYFMDHLTKKLPELPALERFIGYDLIARDWMAPHGLGTHRDIMFKLEKHRVTTNDGYSVTFSIKFENEGDGLISYYAPIRGGSNLRLPHHAPISGYQSEFTIDKKRTVTQMLSGKSREDQNYFLRIRTKKDNKGNITSALYGKIYGDINPVGFAVLPTSKIKFNYYLNPTPKDTNIEFDPAKNLFKDLTVNEEVSLP